MLAKFSKHSPEDQALISSYAILSPGELLMSDVGKASALLRVCWRLRRDILPISYHDNIVSVHESIVVPNSEKKAARELGKAARRSVEDYVKAFFKYPPDVAVAHIQTMYVHPEIDEAAVESLDLPDMRRVMREARAIENDRVGGLKEPAVA